MIIARRFGRSLIERQMSVVDSRSLQCRDQAIELRDIGYRSDPYPVHSAARDLIVAHEDLAVAAAAQPISEVSRIRRV